MPRYRYVSFVVDDDNDSTHPAAAFPSQAPSRDANGHDPFEFRDDLTEDATDLSHCLDMRSVSEIGHARPTPVVHPSHTPSRDAIGHDPFEFRDDLMDDSNADLSHFLDIRSELHVAPVVAPTIKRSRTSRRDARSFNPVEFREDLMDEKTNLAHRLDIRSVSEIQHVVAMSTKRSRTSPSRREARSKSAIGSMDAAVPKTLAHRKKRKAVYASAVSASVSQTSGESTPPRTMETVFGSRFFIGNKLRLRDACSGAFQWAPVGGRVCQ